MDSKAALYGRREDSSTAKSICSGEYGQVLAVVPRLKVANVGGGLLFAAITQYQAGPWPYPHRTVHPRT
jgi:hypothetical protein